jgi:hypothetical protein
VGFDGLMVLKCVGNFIGVFFGAFVLGSGMGCITAIVSFIGDIHARQLFSDKFLVRFCSTSLIVPNLISLRVTVS